MIITDKYDIGIDEAGRGPLLGRVYAGAVILNNSFIDNNLIKDSKKLTPKKRKLAYEWIINNTIYSIGWAEYNEIDEINILQATKLAIDRALEKLDIDNNFNLLIDGTGWENKFNYSTQSIIKGDCKYYAIAAASIIAKESHDNYIKELCIQYPELHEKYDLLNNMGYGTKKHIEGIKKYGYCNFHRKSFKLKN